MKNKPKYLMNNDAELFSYIEEIVHYKWDPIGISGIPQARGEYDSYIHEIYSLVKMGDDAKTLKYLEWIVEDRMGMSFDKDTAIEAINIMNSWKQKILKTAHQGDAPEPASPAR